MQASQSTELVDCVLRGRRDFFYSISAFCTLPGAAFQDTAHTTLYCSGIEDALCNGLVNIKEDYVPTENEIQEAIAFFKEKKLPFIWWSEAKILERYNFQYGGMLTGIAVDLSGNEEKATSTRATVRSVRSKEDLDTFSALFTHTFDMTETAVGQLHTVCETTMQRGEHVHFLAYLDGLPVGTVTLSTTPSSAGIWNLGTLPEYRRKGVGHALLEAALVEARARNHSRVMAILMPKGMAWGIFKKRGFQEVSQFPLYVYGASPEDLE
ncbi:MAG: hypothetical protein S4CHLAM2_15640 [Chlamydiales bacterium]|nr:hypothetical protein [Chlamydiales bacterium]